MGDLSSVLKEPGFPFYLHAWKSLKIKRPIEANRLPMADSHREWVGGGGGME